MQNLSDEEVKPNTLYNASLDNSNSRATEPPESSCVNPKEAKATGEGNDGLFVCCF